MYYKKVDFSTWPRGELFRFYMDHMRVVMSLTVLALAADIPLAINEAEAVQKSWPHFFDALKPLGVEVHYAG